MKKYENNFLFIQFHKNFPGILSCEISFLSTVSFVFQFSFTQLFRLMSAPKPFRYNIKSQPFDMREGDTESENEDIDYQETQLPDDTPSNPVTPSNPGTPIALKLVQLSKKESPESQISEQRSEGSPIPSSGTVAARFCRTNSFRSPKPSAPIGVTPIKLKWKRQKLIKISAVRHEIGEPMRIEVQVGERIGDAAVDDEFIQKISDLMKFVSKFDAKH